MASSAVPAFLTKLWTLVEDPSTNDLICWDMTGASFHVYDQARFAKEVLPLYFKHSNIASFIRQLNMYGFRKVVSVDSGSLKIEKDDLEFSHPCFLRENEHLLEHIKRKVSGATHVVPGSKSGGGGGSSEESSSGGGSSLGSNGGSMVSKVLTDVVVIREKQDSMDGKFETLKRENEALWREVATLRQKHHKQQQIVNKLIQFLVTLVNQSGRSIPNMKRKIPLMINDKPAKMARVAVPITTREEGIPSGYKVQSPPISPVAKASKTSNVGGVQIHDVTDTHIPAEPAATFKVEPGSSKDNYSMLDPVTDDAALFQILNLQENPTFDLGATPGLECLVTLANASPQHSPSTVSMEQSAEPVMVSNSGPLMSTMDAATSQDILPAASSTASASSAIALNTDRPPFCRSPSRPEVVDHLETMQTDLEALKDYLSSSHMGTLDTSTLQGLFNPEMPLPMVSDNLLNLVDEESTAPTMPIKTEPPDIGQIVGTELVTYNPSNDDLAHIFEDLEPEPIEELNTPEVTAVKSPFALNADLHNTTEEVD